MDLILGRHGNTFGPADVPVWVGSANDLPLVERGMEQAREVAAAFLREKARPCAIYCAPLARTKVYAEIVGEALGVSPRIDNRLLELDYGLWSGLSDAQIRERFGPRAVESWNEDFVWPSNAGWGGSKERIMAEVQSFVEDVARDAAGPGPVLAITSNGRLRFFAQLVPDAFDALRARRELKVKTGHLCRIELGAGGALTLSYWNRSPADGLFA